MAELFEAAKWVFIVIGGIVGFAILVQVGSFIYRRCHPPTVTFRMTAGIERTDNGFDDGEDDGRRIDGHPVRTRQEWNRWWACKHNADHMYARLTVLEREMVGESIPEADAAFAEWQDLLPLYNQYCKRFGIWNSIVSDSVPYTVSAAQVSAVNAYMARVRRKYEEAAARRQVVKDFDDRVTPMIFDYLSSQPRHIAFRHEMIKAIRSADDTILREDLEKLIRRMVRDRVLLEKPVDGHYQIRKAPVRKADPSLAASGGVVT